MIISSVKKMTHLLPASLTLSVALALSGCGEDVTTNTDFDSIDTSSPVSDWQLVWSDEFDGTAIDAEKWTHEVNCDGGGNQEQQCYTDDPANSFVSDGTLKIVAYPAEEGAPLPYTSARLNTKYKGDWTYGRFEVRAKMPRGQGTWPAIWMLPTDEVYGGWPNSGEIDIVEAINLKTVDAEGTEQAYVFGTLHYGSDFPNNDSSGKAYLLPDGSNPADDFHTYTIEWQEGEFRWYVDGYLYQTQMQSEVRFNSKGEAVGLKHRGWYSEYFDISTGELELHWDSSPFDQRFHMLLNLAVGGSFPSSNGQGIDPAAFENGQVFEIDYVRIYECSVNPMDGSGCETVRQGYKDEETLVEGAAPIPSPPTPGVANPITIFADEENPAWPLWDCCGGTEPQVVEDDAQHGAVAEFTILDDAGTVLGFNVYESDNPQPFNASSMLTTGSVKFDLKVVTAPTNANAQWLFKIESGAASAAVELPVSAGNNGIEPVVGEWATYSFSLQSLADAGLDISNIDVIMIFPTWGAGAGAIYRVDNVEISPDGDITFPELVLFEDESNPEWPLWDCCGGTVPTEEIDDEEHGVVAEFQILNNDGTVLGFKPPDGAGTQFDASALLTEGVVEFEMKVVSAPADSNSVWKFKIESNGAETAVEVDLATGNNGVEPVVGEWATYTFSLTELADLGLDISAIDVVMVFPAWGTGAGAIFRIDNARIYNPNAGAPAGPSLVAFENAENPDWPLWDCCGGSTPAVVADDAEHGNVAEFSIVGNDGTVLGFNGRDAGNQFDASELLLNGTLSFEMKVVSAPTTSDTPWLLKVEADGNTSFAELPLSDSNEGEVPVVGQWQTYTFDLLDLSDAGLDISAIDIIMIFPTWGTGDGAVYRVDNVVIAGPQPEPVEDGPVFAVYDDAPAEGWAPWDCCAGSTPTEVDEGGEHGNVVEFSVLGAPETVQGFNGRDQGASYDAEALLTSGTFSFDMKVVSAPSDSNAVWLLKIEADGNTSDTGDIPLNTSIEGQDPVVGEWQTYTFDILTLADAGLDVSAIDIIMVFPTWGLSSGAVYRIDNVQFND